MKSPFRMHERESFFKYMNLSTAFKVLDSSSLRWSSPLIFNDPFDVPREVLPDVNEYTIGQALIRKIIYELSHPRDDTSAFNMRIRYLLDFYRTNFPDGVPTELIQKQKELLDNPPVGEGAREAIQEFKDTWTKMLVDRRIICLSESPLIAPMWNHYADSYKGIVLEFFCSDELDSAWLIAKPINYTNEKPMTYSASGMAELLFMREDNVINYINEDITYIKTEDWKYEREWRVSTHKRPMHEGLHSDLTFHYNELKTIIMGPLFDMGELPKILQLSKRYPLVKLAKATFSREGVIEIIQM